MTSLNAEAKPFIPKAAKAVTPPRTPEQHAAQNTSAVPCILFGAPPFLPLPPAAVQQPPASTLVAAAVNDSPPPYGSAAGNSASQSPQRSSAEREERHMMSNNNSFGKGSSNGNTSPVLNAAKRPIVVTSVHKAPSPLIGPADTRPTTSPQPRGMARDPILPPPRVLAL